MNHRKITLWLVFLLSFAILTIAGCSEDMPGSRQDIVAPADEVLEAFDPVLAGTVNEFGLALFKKLLEEQENIFISPTSIATALSMTYNGAGGETKEEMAEVLAITGIDLERLNENNLALLYFLQTADPAVKLDIANSLWMREGMDFDQDFLARNEKYYDAVVTALDFDSPEAVEIINKWVYESTGGLIEDIIEPPIDPMTVLFLINAIYFQGDWSEPFNEAWTKEESFYLPNGEKTVVPFMHRSGKLDYYEEESFQAVRLPYGEKDRLAMYAFLPAEDKDLLKFIQEINNGTWNEWRQGFRQEEGDLFLPRFSMEYEKSLNDVLIDLGMGAAFDQNRADFFDMVPWEGGPRLYISEVKHKSFIEVNEKGTEAAAATSVEMRVESAPAFRFTMKADRPFFFLIYDELTQVIIFMGAVANPGE